LSIIDGLNDSSIISTSVRKNEDLLSITLLKLTAGTLEMDYSPGGDGISERIRNILDRSS
jgi:hypothetical protein